MLRRTFLNGVGALVLAMAARPIRTLAHARGAPWDALRKRVGDRLIPVRSPLLESARTGGQDAAVLFARLRNPYYLGDDPALTQTLGWVDAWTSQPSLYAVAARDAADVSAAIDVARTHALRLVVKGGGHSYFGNSNAADSLLVWTRAMDEVQLHETFRGVDWPAHAEAVPAVSIGAGALWGRVYRTVSAAGRYVQGGGCLTVGVAGFVQGGGFGSLSKTFGTGAANLLEAEVVTADGRVRTVNQFREPDLFYALRGGGGGTFGVVTRLTLRTHPLPATIGAALFNVTAKDDEAWRVLVARTVRFYAETLFNPAWGEQLRFEPGRRLGVSMLCHSLTQAQVRATWQPFLSWLKAHPDDYRLDAEPMLIALPAARFWDPDFLRTLPNVVLTDDRPGAPSANVFWATNLGEAGQVLNAYQSAWLPARLLDPSRQVRLVDALLSACREWPVSLHTNKGLAGGTEAAIAATRETATNPAVLDAFALVICAADAPPAWPGIPGHEPDVAKGRQEAAQVARAMAPIHALVPNAGSYVSEADYFTPNWQQAYWGRHYARLLKTKRRYDPTHLFRGHHCVGSE